MIRIIFADIDGVCNSVQSAKQYRTWSKLDPDCIARLNGLVERTGAKIVISSAWRFGDTEELAELLQHQGITGPIIGETPWMPKEARGREIQTWLDRHPGEIESFVILDDDSDMVHLAPYHVKTDIEVGLTDEDVARAEEILSTIEEVT